MHLEYIHVVGLHALQALVDVSPQPFCRPQMTWLLPHPVRINIAATFRGQEVLIAALTDVVADALLAHAVVRRRVNKVYPCIEHRIEQASGFFTAGAISLTIRTAVP